MIHTLDDHARAQPGAIALMASGISLTYAELYQRVVALAGVMAERDIRRLGIGVGNGLDWILADLAGMMSGIGIVPVPHYFTPGQVEYLLDSSHVDYLLSETGSCPTTGLFGSSINKFQTRRLTKNR